MPSAKDLIERARMFEERAERASDPISRQHYREMAAHYRSLSVEHQEATPHLDRALSMIREHGCKPGAVINPATPVSMLSEVLGRVDHILVMSVNPGFGGQKFIPGALEKIRQLKLARERYNLSFRIEVDGGVGPDNVADLVRSGAEILVAGTSIFHNPDPAEAVRAMKQMAGGALAQKA